MKYQLIPFLSLFVYGAKPAKSTSQAVAATKVEKWIGVNDEEKKAVLTSNNCLGFLLGTHWVTSSGCVKVGSKVIPFTKPLFSKKPTYTVISVEEHPNLLGKIENLGLSVAKLDKDPKGHSASPVDYVMNDAYKDALFTFRNNSGKLERIKLQIEKQDQCAKALANKKLKIPLPHIACVRWKGNPAPQVAMGSPLSYLKMGFTKVSFHVIGSYFDKVELNEDSILLFANFFYGKKQYVDPRLLEKK